MGARGQRERGGVPGVSSFCPNREGPTTFHPVSHTCKPELVDLKFVGDDGDRDKGCDIGMQQGMRYVDYGHRDTLSHNTVSILLPSLLESLSESFPLLAFSLHFLFLFLAPSLPLTHYPSRLSLQA